MKQKLLVIFITALLSNLSLAQDPFSFFPHGVGDTWNTFYSEGYSRQRSIYRDSIGTDGSHNLFFATTGIAEFRIDTAFNVFEPFFGNNLLYKLVADTGEIWENTQSELRWAWVARIETMLVFAKLTVVKIFRYSFGPPDSANSPAWVEHWLASGFGVIYRTGETGYDYLAGCVIDGDTFGIVTSVNDIENEKPSSFFLKQNYPNPFNPSTTIEFDISSESEINLTIYDMLGQTVDVLYDGRINAGTHKIKWDPNSLASGIYICRIRADAITKSIKMLLLK